MDSIARDNQRWVGIHRWTRGLHKAPTRHRVLAAAGPLAAGLVTVGSIWLLLSGFGHPHGKIPPQVVFPAIVGTVLPSSGPAASASSYPARSTTQGTDGRTPGTTTAPTGDVPEMAGAPVPALSPTPAATTAAPNDAPPPLPPPLPPVATSTPPVCPPLPTSTKTKKGPKPHPSPSTGSHW